MSTTNAAETHAALCQQAAELTAAGRPIPESLRMEVELADREACRAIRRIGAEAHAKCGFEGAPVRTEHLDGSLHVTEALSAGLLREVPGCAFHRVALSARGVNLYRAIRAGAGYPGPGQCITCNGAGCADCGNTGVESEAVSHGCRRRAEASR